MVGRPECDVAGRVRSLPDAHESLTAVMVSFQDLNANGFGSCWRYCGDTDEERAAWHGQSRLALSRDYATAYTRCVDWLHAAQVTTTPAVNSYTLKHYVERECGYVPNGALIAAAIHLGVSYRRIHMSPNVLLGVSKRWLRGYMDKIGEVRIGPF